ncbi:MAG: hypothetical protein KDC18_11270 [Alphaproteobacteria bacterium]|nr:hypothetical protein [Alphaproteobacteria bacterium]MCB9929673.1 hypothetical protein [Alphaproteobacteria bacterium]
MILAAVITVSFIGLLTVNLVGLHRMGNVERRLSARIDSIVKTANPRPIEVPKTWRTATLVPAWEVNVYPMPSAPQQANWHGAAQSVGKFLYSADWLSLDMDKKNDVFVGNNAAFVLTSFFRPKVDGNYQFTANLEVDHSIQKKMGLIICYAYLFTADNNLVLGGKLLADDDTDRAVLTGADTVQMTKSQLYPLLASIACVLPKDVNPAAIMVRFGVREPGHSNFSRIPALVAFNGAQ